MTIWITIGIIVFFILDLFVVFYVISYKKRAKKFRRGEQQYIRNHWDRIVKSFQFDPRNAVMDADKLLDYALKHKGFEGSLGEKLKAAGPRFSDINSVWHAHKLRNRIAHEMMQLDSKEARQALGYFKRALNDLGADL